MGQKRRVSGTGSSRAALGRITGFSDLLNTEAVARLAQSRVCNPNRLPRMIEMPSLTEWIRQPALRKATRWLEVSDGA